jgi:1-acyl-sn-glycerol-3-phosphate acyltransferase
MFLSPLLLAVAVVADVLRGRLRRWPALRFAVLLVVYASVVLIAFSRIARVWVRSGMGARLGEERWQDLLWEQMRWWIGRLFSLLTGVCGVRYEVEGLADLRPGPVVVLARHVSLADAVFTVGVVHLLAGLRPRVVVMRELQREPVIDLVANHMPHHFVDRVRTAGEVASIAEMARDLGAGDAAVIFPEGALADPARLARVLEKIRRDDPERHPRVAPLRDLMPVRPGGTVALLQAAPAGADVVIVGHVGFESLRGRGWPWTALPATEAVRAKVWRYRGEDLPTTGDELARWLDERWLEVDAWVSAQRLG